MDNNPCLIKKLPIYKYILNTEKNIKNTNTIRKKSILFELSTNNVGFDNTVEKFGKGHE